MNKTIMEESLRQSEKKFRTLFDAAPVGIALVDKDGIIREANNSLMRLLPVQREEFIGKNFIQLVQAYGLDAEENIKDFKNRLKEAPAKKELTFLNKNNSKTTITVQSSAMKNGDEISGVLYILNDVTESRKMEEDLRVAQKLESLGIFAGGLAHDLNNILTEILGNISLAKIDAAKESPVRETLSAVERASLRAKSLTRQLATFAKGGVPHKEFADLGNIAKETASFVLSGSNVKAEYHVPGDLWPAEMDKGLINQVIDNLVINAVQAMPGGGTVKLKLENKEINNGGFKGLSAGSYVKLSVEDQGTGIPRESLVKIFDPFFTTKQKGSGLGLSIAYSIIRKHNGYICAYSEPGKGTRFDMYLPAQKAAKIEAGTEDKIISGKGKMLVMDDEEAVRRTSGNMLKYLGYEAEFAGDGVEAIDMYREAKQFGKPFDAVIMDLTIPGGMGGMEAVKELAMIDPGVKAIVSSGYSDDPVMAEFRMYGFKGILPKPYTVEQLSAVLHKVMKRQ